MRSVDVSIVTKNIKEMCIQANHFLSEDMDIAMKNAVETEKAPLGKQILTQLQENLKIAGKDMIPICHDRSGGSAARLSSASFGCGCGAATGKRGQSSRIHACGFVGAMSGAGILRKARLPRDRRYLSGRVLRTYSYGESIVKA